MRTAQPDVDPRPIDADVIILSWNRPDDVADAITSALDQVEVSRRILVVDQGSEPQNIVRLEQLIDAKPDVELKKLGQNTGVAGGRNIATAMGNGRYVIALDSDAVFGDPATLARAVRHLDANPRLAAIGFRIENYYTGQNDDTSWDYPGHHPDERFFSTRFVGAGHAIRRMAFEAAGGYDARLFFCQEELDLSYRMLNLGYRIEYFPDVKVRHKISPSHRVAWDQGRYFFTVRNALYSSYKFGTPLSRLGLGAAAFLARGLANGVGVAAARGLYAAIRMCAAYARSTEDKSLYRLLPETREYIGACEPWRSEPAITKMRRQFKRLPGRV